MAPARIIDHESLSKLDNVELPLRTRVGINGFGRIGKQVFEFALLTLN